MRIITLFLTCANEKEAGKIADVLLKKKLAVCIKKVNIKSRFYLKIKSIKPMRFCS